MACGGGGVRRAAAAVGAAGRSTLQRARAVRVARPARQHYDQHAGAAGEAQTGGAEQHVAGGSGGAQHAETLAAVRDLAAEMRMQMVLQRAELEALRREVDHLRQQQRSPLSAYSSSAGDVASSLQVDMFESRDSAAEAAWPSLAIVDAQPHKYRELSNGTLALLATAGSDNGQHSARRERLIREIMRVDRCSWEDAQKKLCDIDAENEKAYWACTGPHRIGIALGFLAGMLAIPLVFDRHTAALFAQYMVLLPDEEWPGADEGLSKVEGLAELTCFQIGTFTWAWMEPMIGTASFFLLCAQFVRTNLKKMNTKPFTELVLSWRADRLARLYPQYSKQVVRDWAKHLPRVGLGLFPVYEHRWSSPYRSI